jgi:hypothetical protein
MQVRYQAALRPDTRILQGLALSVFRKFANDAAWLVTSDPLRPFSRRAMVLFVRLHRSLTLKWHRLQEENPYRTALVFGCRA